MQQEELESLEDPNEAKEEVAGALSAVFGGKNRLGGIGGGEHVFVFEFHQRDTSQVQQEKICKTHRGAQGKLAKVELVQDLGANRSEFFEAAVIGARGLCQVGRRLHKIVPPEVS